MGLVGRDSMERQGSIAPTTGLHPGGDCIFATSGLDGQPTRPTDVATELNQNGVLLPQR